MLIAAVLAIFVSAQTPVIIHPALNGLSMVFSEVSYSQILLLSTIVSLPTIVFSTACGFVAGKYISFRNLTIIGILLMMVGGVLPIFMTNFYLVLVMRLIVGIGTGFVIPLGSALIFRLFDSEQAARLQGVSTLVMNIGGMAFQYLAGIMCSINPIYTWLVYGTLLIPLLLVVFFLRGDPVTQISKTPSSAQRSAPCKLPIASYVITFGYAVNFIIVSPLMLNMSTMLADDNLGTAATAGTILALYTFGGMLAGVAFGKLYQKISRFIIAFAFCLETVGLALIAFGNTVFLMGLGTLITGFAVYTVFPTCMMDFSQIMSKENILKANGIFMAALSLGSFLSSWYITAIQAICPGSAVRFTIVVSTCISVVIGIVWFLGRSKLLKSIQAQH